MNDFTEKMLTLTIDFPESVSEELDNILDDLQEEEEIVIASPEMGADILVKFASDVVGTILNSGTQVAMSIIISGLIRKVIDKSKKYFKKEECFDFKLKFEKTDESENKIIKDFNTCSKDIDKTISEFIKEMQNKGYIQVD
jgi:hypothetical protein